MYENDILQCLTNTIPEKSVHNTTIPYNLVLSLSIAIKIKKNTSISDIQYVITNHRVIAKLGYSIIDTNKNLKDGMTRESILRFLFGKYEAKELFSAYNNIVQNYIMPKLDIVPNIHILDCTELPVNLDSENYEKPTYTKINMVILTENINLQLFVG